MSLILPVIILMLLGVLDYGVLLQQDMRVADSARAGAEYGLLRGHGRDLAGIEAVATRSALNIPSYKVVATNYCSCTAAAGHVSCGTYTACGAYGLPNVYVQVTASARLPLLFGIEGSPTSISVQSVSLVRAAWPGN